MYARRSFAAMARYRRHRVARVCAVLCGLVAGTGGASLAFALAEDGGMAADAPPGLCPSPDAVWLYITQLVPSAAPQLVSAKGRVDIVDLGDRYRVHVTTDEGGLERTYTDRLRDCEQRTRFAAEFIVLALLPPQMLLGNPQIAPDAGPPTPTGPSLPPATPPTPEGVSPAPPPPPLPPPPPPPRPRVTGPVKPARVTSVVRIEATAVSETSASVLGAPHLTMWGGELRVRVGSGVVAGVAAIEYLPTVEFGEGALRLSLTRVPTMAGIRVRSEIRAFDVSGDVGVAAVVERYEGLSLHVPADTTRLTPGLEVGATVSPHPWAGLSALARVRASWLPMAQDLVTLPAGALGKTPTFWIGAVFGVSLEL